MRPLYRIERLGPAHDRAEFTCGVEPLDQYLRTRATQDIRRRVAACYIAVEEKSGKIPGYYTLAAGGIDLADLPQELARRLPQYPSVPVARPGRLAIEVGFQGRKLGMSLLADAGKRVLGAGIAAFALVVNAKDDAAEGFHRRFGFMPLGVGSRRLILPLATFEKAFGRCNE